MYRVILIHTLRYQVTLLLAEVMILKESSPQFRKFTSSTVHVPMVDCAMFGFGKTLTLSVATIPHISNYASEVFMAINLSK